jgi:anti-anti-sigma factor
MIIERMNETVFAELHGELDIAYAGDLRDQLSFELISGKRVIIDLRRLEFLDITAVRTILEIDIQLRLTGGHLILIRGPKGTDRVFELMGLERRLDFVSLARSQPI